MTIPKRVSIAAAASVVTVGVIFALLNVFPGSILGKLFIAAGFPLGSLIFLATPEGFLRELAPQGGPDAIGWAIAIGALITWLTLFFFLWFVAIGLMRSNTTPHADARDVPAHASGSGARAGGRERYTARD